MPFPIFQSHESVTCFSCRQVIEGAATISGYGSKQGEYVKHCKCGLCIWYDINADALTEVQVMALNWCYFGLTEASRVVRDIPRQVLDALLARGFVVSHPGAEKEWTITPVGRATLAVNQSAEPNK